VKVAASIDFGPAGFIPAGLFDAMKQAVQADMANAFATTVNHNFGDSGEDRPTDWPLLRTWYALEAHGGDRTPKLQLSGVLQASIQIDDMAKEARVYTDCDYADKHQYGYPENHVPPRPFFPMYGTPGNEQITEKTEAKCLEYAEKRVLQMLKDHFSR
jgi:phage gpG-like protein